MSDQYAPQGWSNQPSVPPSTPGRPSASVAAPVGAHPLLWARMPADQAAPPVPRSPEEALAMMERSHAATIALLPEDADPDAEETTPLTRAWFDGVRDACARTGRVPGVERMLFEWWINDPPIEGLSQLPWLFGVWQGHWICWAGTTPWAAADLATKSTFDAVQVAVGVQFGADPEHPPASPWPPFGTAAMAVPTTILLALSGKPAARPAVVPVTPLYVAPAPPPPPPPPPAPTPVPIPDAPAVGAEAAGDDLAPEPVDADAPAPADDALPAADLDAEAEADSETGIEAEATEPDPPGEPTDGLEEVTAGVVAAEADEAPAPDAPDEGGPSEEPSPFAPQADPEPSLAADPTPAPVAAVAPIEPAPAPSLPPAGWFPDPAGRHALRYWDGTDWTAHAADPGSDTIHDPI